MQTKCNSEAILALCINGLFAANLQCLSLAQGLMNYTGWEYAIHGHNYPLQSRPKAEGDIST